MPQIGWFEIIIIVALAILIIGPKDFPIVLRKIAHWISSIKKYFNDIQKDITDTKNVVEDEISIEPDLSKSIKDEKKDE